MHRYSPNITPEWREHVDGIAKWYSPNSALRMALFYSALTELSSLNSTAFFGTEHAVLSCCLNASPRLPLRHAHAWGRCVMFLTILIVLSSIAAATAAATAATAATADTAAAAATAATAATAAAASVAAGAGDASAAAMGSRLVHLFGSGEEPVEPQTMERTLFCGGHSSLDAGAERVSGKRGVCVWSRCRRAAQGPTVTCRFCT